MWGEEDDRKRKPAPKILKRLVWERDKGICRVCGNPADPFDWELGHNRAVSRGGKLTLKNTFVVHPSCNRSMATKTIKELRKTLGLTDETDEVRELLKGLTLKRLKEIARNHGIKVQGPVEEGLFYSERLAPSKRQYVNALTKRLSLDEVKRETGL